MANPNIVMLDIVENVDLVFAINPFVGTKLKLTKLLDII
jgi:hypothetical protein